MLFLKAGRFLFWWRAKWSIKRLSTFWSFVNSRTQISSLQFHWKEHAKWLLAVLTSIFIWKILFENKHSSIWSKCLDIKKTRTFRPYWEFVILVLTFHICLTSLCMKGINVLSFLKRLWKSFEFDYEWLRPKGWKYPRLFSVNFFHVFSLQSNSLGPSDSKHGLDMKTYWKMKAGRS